MQAPDNKTPVSDCQRLSVFHGAVLARFPEHKRLLLRIEPAEKQLLETHEAYVAAVLRLIQPRVAVRVVDYFADQRVNLIHLAAKTADGGYEGAITAQLFPDGKSVIVQPVGAAEVVELVHLETRLEKLGGPIAAEHLDALRKLRTEYESALAARHAALVEAGAKRQLRNLARHIWVDAYVANQGAIKEAYPRNRRMQDLFFDDIRTSRAESGETEGDNLAPPAAANG